MITSRRVRLGSSHLDQVDESIVIQGIEEQDGKENTGSAAFMRGGSRRTYSRRETLDVVVRFGILLRKEEAAARSQVLEKVNAWAAGGGWLYVNYRENRRLYVQLLQAPGAGNIREWNREYSITFRAWGVPWWRETTPEAQWERKSAATAASGTLHVNGSARTVADAEILNKSGQTISTVKVTAGSSWFELTGLAMAKNETLVVDHTAEGVLRIRLKGTDNKYRSVMARRTPESSDDLWVNPGDITVGFTSQRGCTAVISARGRFL